MSSARRRSSAPTGPSSPLTRLHGRVPLRARDKLFGLFLYMLFYESCLYWLNIWALFTVKNRSWVTRPGRRASLTGLRCPNGGVPERPNGAVLKTADCRKAVRGFKSHPRRSSLVRVDPRADAPSRFPRIGERVAEDLESLVGLDVNRHGLIARRVVSHDREPLRAGIPEQLDVDASAMS